MVIESAQEGPCALASNANVSTMLFKVSDWPGRHSSLSQSVAGIGQLEGSLAGVRITESVTDAGRVQLEVNLSRCVAAATL